MTDAERAELIRRLRYYFKSGCGRDAADEIERLGKRVAELERVRRAEDDVLCAASIAARELEPRGNRCIRALADSLRALSRAEVAITGEGAFKRGEEPDHDCG